MQEKQLCHLWHIKLTSAVKFTEERIEARKTLLPSVILQLLVNGNDQDIPILLVANQVGMRVRFPTSKCMLNFPVCGGENLNPPHTRIVPIFLYKKYNFYFSERIT